MDERWRGYLDPSTGLPGREDTWILRNTVVLRYGPVAVWPERKS